MWTQIIVAVLVIIVIAVFRASFRPRNFPPGPLSLPLAGSVPFLDVRNLGKSFKDLSVKYGDIFSVFVGSKPVVVLNSYSVIKEALSREEFSGRPGNFSGTFFQKGKTGITTTEGKHFHSQKEFLHNHLKNLTGGQGYKGFEETILDEVADLRQGLAKKEGEAVAVNYKLNVAIINILWNLACGRKLHAQQQEFLAVYECVDKIVQFMSLAAIFSFIPILTKILPESITNIERGRYYRNRFHEITEKWIREHRQDYRGNRTGDFQDAYLEKLNSGEEYFTEAGLAALVREMFIIGGESQSVMLRWGLRILSVNPKVQLKVQEELDTVVGRGLDVTWDKKDELPYSMAVMREIQRFADIAPTALLHKTVVDVEFHGYTLPQNTLVMANLTSCHRCPDFWQNPDQFRPEHFLDGEGNLVAEKEGFLAYGIGKRKCPGAELADMELFLIMTNLLSTFTFSLPDGDGGECGTQFEAGTAVLRNPKPYKIVTNHRE